MSAENLLLVSQPAIDTRAFIAALNSARLEQLSFHGDKASEYLHLLARMEEPDVGILAAHREAGALLGHLHYGFLMGTTRNVAHELMRETRLNVTAVPSRRDEIELVLVSGDMIQWREAVINCCSGRVSFDLRERFTAILAEFDKLGFQQVFAGYKRKGQRDRTICLEVK